LAAAGLICRAGHCSRRLWQPGDGLRRDKRPRQISEDACNRRKTEKHMANIKRKNIRLSRQIYANENLLFSVTICTKERKPIFGNPNWSRKITRSLKTGPFGENVQCLAYCLMPDHLHLLISPRNGNLVDSISGWKSYTASLLRKEGVMGGCWQRGFYDHALRKEEDVQAVAQYIVNNPVRKKLVQNWQEYPFAWHQWI
jgi:REP element-mobilizing transposase RayT